MIFVSNRIKLPVSQLYKQVDIKYKECYLLNFSNIVQTQFLIHLKNYANKVYN